MFYSLLIVLSSFFISEAVPSDPITWSYDVVIAEDESLEVIFTADIEGKWVLYSQHTDPDGPVPTSFTFGTNKCVIPVGEVEEKSEMILEHSDLFGVDVMKYKNQSVFTQKVDKKCAGRLNCIIQYMTCDGERCLPPKKVTFEIEIN